MHRLITLFARLFVVFAIAVAMTGSSFAHRVAAPQLDESLLAYVAAGGVLDEICGEAGFDAGGAENCDACRLVDSTMLPANGAIRLADIDAHALQDYLQAVVSPVVQVTNPACPVRAPPYV